MSEEGEGTISVSWLGSVPVDWEDDEKTPDLNAVEIFVEKHQKELGKAIRDYINQSFGESIADVWKLCSEPSISISSDGSFCLDFELTIDPEHGISVNVEQYQITAVGGQGDFWDV